MVLEKILPTRRRSPEALGTEVLLEASLATWSDTNDRRPEASRTAPKASWMAFELLRTPSSESLQMAASEALRMAPESSQLESKSRKWRLDRRERHLNRHFWRLNRRRRRERHLILCGFCSGDIGELRRRRWAQVTSIPVSSSSSDVDSFVDELRQRFREWRVRLRRQNDKEIDEITCERKDNVFSHCWSF